MNRLQLRHLILVLLGLAGSVAGWGAVGPPPQRPVLERWLNALGGRVAVERVRATYVWARLRSSRLTGRSEEWNTARGEIRSVADFNSFRRIMGFDGARGHIVDENRKVLELSGTSLEELRTEAYFAAYGQFFPARRPGEARELGLEYVNGVGFHVVELSAEGGRPVRVYLDPATFLPRRLRRIQDADTAWTVYSRYLPVDGVMEAFKIESWTSGRPDTSVFEVEVLQHLASPPPPEFFQPPRDTVRDFAFSGGADSVEIPFQIWGDHVVVAARSHGSKSLPFLLDTGAEASDLEASLARRWHLVNQAPMQLLGTGGSQEAGVVSLDTLYLSGMALFGQRVAAVDLSGVRPGGKALGGVLGYDFLSRFVVQLDFERRIMTLYDPAKAPGPAGEIVPFDLDSFVPRVETLVNDSIPARFQVDTGAPATAVFFRNFWESHGLLPPGTPRREVETSGLGGRSRNQEARFGSIALGPFRIQRPLAFFHGSQAGATRSLEDAGLLGMAFWRRFHVVLDYAHRRMGLRPNRDFAQQDGQDSVVAKTP